MQIKKKTLYKSLCSFNLTFYIPNREQNIRGDQENLSYMVFQRDLFIGYYCPLMLKSNIAILQSYSVAMSRNSEIILYFLFYCIAVFRLMTLSFLFLNCILYIKWFAPYLKGLNNHSAG